MKAQKNIVLPLLLTVITFIAFSNSISGSFVYDDHRQIVANPLIQNPELFGKAISSDVWAFKGDGTAAASNYWRPVFTVWSIINFALFGLDPTGWHVLNILLHIAICLLTFFLLRRWDISSTLAFCIALIFAIHPLHTESVAWIAGSPDLLFSLFFLLSVWFIENLSSKSLKNSGIFDLVMGIGFYILALGSKEIAVFSLPIIWLLFSDRKNIPAANTRLKDKIFPGYFIYFAIAAISYFLVRWIVLDSLSLRAEDASSGISVLLTAPSIFLFYIFQIICPFQLGPNYSLRPVETAGLISFILPLILSALVLFGLYLMARKGIVQKLGLLIFVCPLLPVFGISAFSAEQIVHDRYLYFPLLGFLMMVMPGLFNIVRKADSKTPDRSMMIFTAAISVVLVFQTFSYNRIWLNDLALWKHAVKTDENSSYNWLQLGFELTELNRPDEALAAYDRSLQIKRQPLALMGKARIQIEKGQLEPAIKDIQEALATPADKINAYTLYQCYEALALAQQQGNQFDEAEKTLRNARERLPVYRAALTEKLSVILYLQSKKAAALTELESVKTQAIVEMLPASKGVFLRLGMLYAENGNKAEAKANLQMFITSTEQISDKITKDERAMAKDILKKLS